MATQTHSLTLHGASNSPAASRAATHHMYLQPAIIQCEWTTKIQQIETNATRNLSNGDHLNENGCRISASKQRTRCSHCNIELLKKALPRHIRSTHSYARSSAHRCSLCGLSFVRKDSFERHLKEQHNDGKTECDRCGSRVGLRALKGHQQTQKCNYAGVIPMQSTREPMSDSQTSRLHRQLGLKAVLDPLVMITSYQRLMLSTWISSKPLFESNDFTRTVSLEFGSVNKCSDLYSASEMRNSFMDISNCPEIWRLRSLVLAQTREWLSFRRKGGAASLDLGFHHDSIIAVALLHSADQTLFGKTSVEAQLQTSGLVTLMASVTPTDRVSQRFEEPLVHAWRSMDHSNDSIDRLRAQPLVAILTYGSFLAYKFWYNPEDRRWIVYDLRDSRENVALSSPG